MQLDHVMTYVIHIFKPGAHVSSFCQLKYLFTMNVIVLMVILSTVACRANIAGMRSTMVPVRERQEASLCRYDVVVDHDPKRVPDRVDKVLCRQDGCKCVDAGDFKCTQLYTQLNVSYTGKSVLQYDILDVELGCVCARTSGRADLQSIMPDLV